MSGGADSEVTVTRTVPQLPVATDGIGTGKFLTESGLYSVFAATRQAWQVVSWSQMHDMPAWSTSGY